MEELQEGFWTALLYLLLGGLDPGPAPSPPRAESQAAAIVERLAAGDSWGLTVSIEEAYERAGISLNDTLTWQFQPYDAIVNWYNPRSEVINLAELPTEAQIAPYWDNWSQVLTGGRWDWRAFFADADEARALAGFNQFVLAAHEYGHALAYRYDPAHVARNGGEINCRELAADRLAAGLLEELAEDDARLARWRLRYAELAAAINAAIDPALRYAPLAYADLDADCAVMTVAQPDEDSMTPYASAYFVRWQALLATDLSPLAALYQTHLLAPWRAALAPGLPLARSVDLVGWVDGRLDGNIDRDGEIVWLRPGFAPDGKLFVMEYAIRAQGSAVALDLAYGPAGMKKKTVLDDVLLEIGSEDPDFFDLAAFLPLGPGHFLAASADIWDDSDNMVLLELRRGPEGWRHRAVQPLPGEQDIDVRLAFAANGAIVLDRFDFGEPSGWTRYRLDLEDLTLTPIGPLPDRRQHVYGQLPDGRDLLIDKEAPMVLLAESGSAPVRIAGNGLQGFKHPLDPLEAEFAGIVTAIGLADRIRLLDYDPIAAQFSIRDVVLE